MSDNQSFEDDVAYVYNDSCQQYIELINEPTDFKILFACGTEIDCHKEILMDSSTFFDLLFKGGYIENTKNELNLYFRNDGEMFKRIYKYFTHGHLWIKPGEIAQVVEAVNYYQLQDYLKESIIDVCEQAIINLVDATNAKCWFDFGVQYCLSKVFTHCATHYFDYVCLSDEFMNLSLQEVIDIIKHDKLTVQNKDNILTCCDAWINYDSVRKAYILELYSHVRISKSEVNQELVKRKLSMSANYRRLQFRRLVRRLQFRRLIARRLESRRQAAVRQTLLLCDNYQDMYYLPTEATKWRSYFDDDYQLLSEEHFASRMDSNQWKMCAVADGFVWYTYNSFRNMLEYHDTIRKTSEAISVSFVEGNVRACMANGYDLYIFSYSKMKKEIYMYRLNIQSKSNQIVSCCAVTEFCNIENINGVVVGNEIYMIMHRLYNDTTGTSEPLFYCFNIQTGLWSSLESYVEIQSDKNADMYHYDGKIIVVGKRSQEYYAYSIESMTWQNYFFPGRNQHYEQFKWNDDIMILSYNEEDKVKKVFSISLKTMEFRKHSSFTVPSNLGYIVQGICVKMSDVNSGRLVPQKKFKWPKSKRIGYRDKIAV